MKLYFEKKVTKTELVTSMLPYRSVRQVFSHFHKAYYKYERKFGYLRNKSKNLSQLSEMLKVFRSESKRRWKEESKLIFEDELTQKTLTVNSSIFECLVKSQSLKRQDCENLNLTIDDCSLNLACQVKYLELAFTKRVSKDIM